jgi:tetratricopeptide (TPR) repeat protein
LPGWQKLYHELKDKNFEIISVAQDTGGVKDAGPWIKAANPEFTALIDDKQQVTMLYNMVNVPTAVWINEQGKIVRPNEVAYVDNRYTYMHHVESAPYLAAIQDWAQHSDKSVFALSEDEVKRRLTPETPDHARAAAEFALGEYLYAHGSGPDAIPHFKEAQRLSPDNWNYKRQAWALSDAERDYGTTFMKEVMKLKDKPYYTPRQLPETKKQDESKPDPDKKNQ